MEAPKKIKPKGLGDYLAVISKSVFQSGMSWQVVEAKWDGFLEAFDGFDPEKVAAYDSKKVEQLVEDKAIVRNRRKIEATIHNSQTLLEIEDEFGEFTSYLRSHSDFEALVKDLRKRFKFLGDTGTYVFLYVVGEKVPPHEEWMKSREK